MDDGSRQGFVLYLAPSEIFDVAPTQSGITAEDEGVPEFAITQWFADEAAVFITFQKFLQFLAGVGFRFDIFGGTDAEIAVFGSASNNSFECPEVIGGGLAGKLIGKEGPESLAEILGDFYRKDSGLFDKEFELVEATLKVTVAWSFILFDKLGVVVEEIFFESVDRDVGCSDGLLVDHHLGFLGF